jgi:hypothetical protein
MISVIMPLGQRQRSPGFWLLRGLLYLLSITAAGAATGALVGALGGVVRAVVPWPALLVLVGVLALAYAGHEAGRWRLPQPQNAWQLPNEWIVRWPLLGSVIFGLVLGAGVFTFIPFTSFYLLLAWEALLGRADWGAALGAVYGLTRGLPVFLGAWTTRQGRPITPLHLRLIEATPRLHRLTAGGLVLAAVALALPLLAR